MSSLGLSLSLGESLLTWHDAVQKKEQQKAENDANAAAGGKKKKVTAAQLRVQKGQYMPGLRHDAGQNSHAGYVADFCPRRGIADLSELSLGKTMQTDFPDADDILHFTLTIEPDEGMYRTGRFTFSFDINQNFPHEPPKVRCKEKIYHPNIDLEGKVCLNILREDWKPVLNLNAVIVGLQVRSRCPSRVCPEPRCSRGTMLMVASRAVPLPRAQCIRSPQQGGCRRPAIEQGGIQAERSDVYGRWLCQGHRLRPGAEVGHARQRRRAGTQMASQTGARSMAGAELMEDISPPQRWESCEGPRSHRFQTGGFMEP